MPFCAKPFQIAAWFAPPKRALSAREHGVAGVEHARRALLEQERVEHQLDPAATARALLRRQRRGGRRLAVGAAQLQRLVRLRVGAVVLRDQLASHVEHRGAPHLAVGVHLRAGDVVPDVAVLQRVGVERVVADAGHLVAGDVGTLDPRVAGADRVVVLEEVLERHLVAPRLTHGAGLQPGQPVVRAADHAVGDGVGVLVPVDRGVEVTVRARRVEGCPRSAGRGTGS